MSDWHHDNKHVPLNLTCRLKNKSRLTDLLNKIIFQFEHDDKREEDFLKPKIVRQIEVVNQNTYVFLEPSTTHGNDFKSLMDCIYTKDETTLKQHFK